jgi:hypothetical protein
MNCQCGNKRLQAALRVLDDYVGHVGDMEHPGTIPVPIRILRELREAIRGNE